MTEFLAILFNYYFDKSNLPGMYLFIAMIAEGLSFDKDTRDIVSTS